MYAQQIRCSQDNRRRFVVVYYKLHGLSTESPWEPPHGVPSDLDNGYKYALEACSHVSLTGITIEHLTMTSCQAIVVGGDGKTAHITDVVVPEPAEGWLLVRVKAVAINPTDWKHVAKGWAPVGSRVGCDYAGVVEKIGLGDTAGFSVGDPVAGFTHGWYVTLCQRCLSFVLMICLIQ